MKIHITIVVSEDGPHELCIVVFMPLCGSHSAPVQQ